MFTGLIETIGTVRSVEVDDSRARVSIDSPAWSGDLTHGESISVNGVCVTVASFEDSQWSADLMKVTLDTTTLGSLEVGSRVNLERAVPVGGRLGGHIVQGHVDATAQVVARERAEHWDDVTLTIPAEQLRYVVPKGSITVNGVSLTVASLAGERLSVSLIPTTLEDTTLGDLAVGDQVNIEVDILGKYVERLVKVPDA